MIMKAKQFGAFCAALALPLLCSAEEIVVLVGGIFNWGPDELLGIPYWGFSTPRDFLPGKQENYPEEIEKETGLPTFVANVGPISSMHDRACELWAILHGDRTDFGYNHSRIYSHTRFGRDFTRDGPLFRQGKLGDVGADGQINTVNLIGHSFGGNTIRYFERVIHRGLPSEANYPSQESPVSSFFVARENATGLIRSVTTLATPHDGSTLHTLLGSKITDVIKKMVLFVVAFLPDSADVLFDFDMGHFGLDPRRNENSSQYMDRIFSSPIFFENFTDTVEYDLSPRAMYNFNKGGPRTYPGTYYLAYSTSQTTVKAGSICVLRVGEGSDAVPNDDIELIMLPTAILMGDLTNARSTGFQCFEQNTYKACDEQIDIAGPWNDKGYEGWCADNSYEENDGLVPRRVSIGPGLGYPWDSTRPRPLSMIERGGCMSWSPIPDNQWFFIDVGVDHTQMVGWRTNRAVESINNVYLRDIPAHINRIKQGGDPDGYTCCVGAWCKASSFDPPSPYPREVKPDPPPRLVFCFSGGSTVMLEDGKRKRMSSVVVGDKVLVGKGKFEPIFGFAHRSASVETNFVQIETSAASLQLTPNHLIFVSEKGPIPAHQVELGDGVFDEKGNLAVVVSIKDVVSRGIFAPLTPSGEIVVDGILASCFVSLDGSSGMDLFGFRFPYHNLSWVFVFPRRVACLWLNSCGDEAYSVDGIATWLSNEAMLTFRAREYGVSGWALVGLLFSLWGAQFVFYLMMFMILPIGCAVWMSSKARMGPHKGWAKII